MLLHLGEYSDVCYSIKQRTNSNKQYIYSGVCDTVHVTYTLCMIYVLYTGHGVNMRASTPPSPSSRPPGTIRVLQGQLLARELILPAIYSHNGIQVSYDEQVSR